MKKSFIHKLTLICIIMVTLLSCSSPDESKKYPKPITEALNNSARAISKKYHFQIAGTGISMPKGKLSYLGFHMIARGPLSIDELRLLIIGSSKLILEEINSTKDIELHLFSYPATELNITLSISLIDKNGQWIDYPQLDGVTIQDGTVSYKTHSKNSDGVFHSTTIVEETYEEALLKM